MTNKKKNSLRIGLLILLSFLSGLFYLFFNIRGSWEFALYLRIPKLIAFFIVSVCISFATIPFQTMTENHLLSPSIIGIDSLYTFFQTLTVFYFGSQSILNTNVAINFILSTVLVLGASLGLFYLFFKKIPNQIYLMLLFGVTLRTLVSSLNQFLQVIIDPNEYTIVLSKTLTSFNQINVFLIGLTILVAIPCVLYLSLNSKVLDVIHLGRDYASNLGIEVDQQYLKFFMIISILTATTTSLVGPVSFLGFLGANISYRLFYTYKHRILFVGSSLVTFLILISGQTIVEHVFLTQTTLGVVIDFIGGLYFILLLMKERD